MRRVPAEARRGLRFGALALATIVALVAVATDPADARSRRKRHHGKRHHAAQSYNPPYADIVVDAKTGAVLHQANPDSLRHPASLTKIMTLYLLFEQLEAGTINGYCVGEPWNQQAIFRGIGVPVITDYEIWKNNPEKVFGVTREWAEKNPNTHLALVKALIRAAMWLDADNGAHRPEAAQILSRAEYVGAGSKPRRSLCSPCAPASNSGSFCSIARSIPA